MPRDKKGTRGHLQVITDNGERGTPASKYHTIVIDPPWPVQPHRFTGKAARRGLPYDTMKLDAIRAIPIDKWADDDCVMFLWSTQSTVPHTFDLLDDWGFRYVFMITWHKNTGTSFHGVYRDSEFACCGVRGKYPFKPRGRNIRTVITAPALAHSEKPAKFYRMLAATCPAPRVDLYARRRHAGFDAWGDQVELVMQEVLP